MVHPIAVLLSDVHYSLSTLALADTATRMAINKANHLQLPLVITGDLHDTKANLRGECVNAMIATFKLCEIKPIILVGNHCKINEKSIEHSLNFLEPYATVIDRPTFSNAFGFKGTSPYFIPYQHDPNEFVRILGSRPEGTKLVFVHQGMHGSEHGEYAHDKSAVSSSIFEGLRVISGHYHCRQTINCGSSALFDYVGNPYTNSFAEAQDPEKGFQVLYSDGTLEFNSCELRQHTIIEKHIHDLRSSSMATNPAMDDLVWVKLSGTREELADLTKEAIGSQLGIPGGFRLDLIPTNDIIDITLPVVAQTQPQILHDLIESLDAGESQKKRLQILVKELT